jgi:hypothetical protein
MINTTQNTINKDAFLIEKLKLDLIRDIENYLEFDDLTEEEQSEICEEIAMNEYDGNNYDYDVYDEAIFELASEKMGFIRPVKRWGSSEIDYKEESEALHYNLSYSQGYYAFIKGDYNLNKLIEKVGSKQLINDLRFIHRKAWGGSWEIDFAINKDGFIIEREDAGRFEEDTNILDFISELEYLQEKRKIKSKVLERVIETLSKSSGSSRFNGSTRTDKNIIEQAFYDFEYNLKKRLYDDIESQEKYAREQWIEDLKESLQGGIYNRADKIFKYKRERINAEVFNTKEDILCYFAMKRTGCKIFATTHKPKPENMDFQVFYDLKNGNFICEGIWNPIYKSSEYLYYNTELQRIEYYINGILQYNDILDSNFITKEGFNFENGKYVKFTKIYNEKIYYIN